MIKSLRQARMTDGLPRVVKRQEWVIALSEALGLAMGQALDYTDESQIYTRLYTAPEAVLDVLAVDWKVDWYDTGFTLEQKRETIKTALMVRRLMGTAAAVKLQVHTLYPDAEVKEWFQYDGRPGCFRVNVPLPEEGISATDFRRLKTGILTTKNERSHLDVIDIRHETEGAVLVGGFSVMGQTIEIWPELVETLEIVTRSYTGGAASARQGMEVWPELAEQIEATAELGRSGTAAGQVVEIYPKGGE